MRQGRAIALPAIPGQDRRDPRVKGRPQAGPAGTRSALDAWACRPVSSARRRPHYPLRSTQRVIPLATGMCCDNRQNPPKVFRRTVHDGSRD